MDDSLRKCGVIISELFPLHYTAEYIDSIGDVQVSLAWDANSG